MDHLALYKTSQRIPKKCQRSVRKVSQVLEHLESEHPAAVPKAHGYRWAKRYSRAQTRLGILTVQLTHLIIHLDVWNGRSLLLGISALSPPPRAQSQKSIICVPS
jgi:hypothetical protein